MINAPWPTLKHECIIQFTDYNTVQDDGAPTTLLLILESHYGIPAIISGSSQGLHQLLQMTAIFFFFCFERPQWYSQLLPSFPYRWLLTVGPSHHPRHWCPCPAPISIPPAVGCSGHSLSPGPASPPTLNLQDMQGDIPLRTMHFVWK